MIPHSAPLRQLFFGCGASSCIDGVLLCYNGHVLDPDSLESRRRTEQAPAPLFPISRSQPAHLLHEDGLLPP
ncbi:hypothetical protein [Roseiflexus sp.]|uniref:hypothetical protein n=1 Tax=Roseiflexus sp. TaxID=2562120 RepID=UPI0025E9EB9E|nr:hypothetical protein [Roseiflexus sp.]MCL6539146.1 hypothetical protein [Roseiflexus sp.]